MRTYLLLAILIISNTIHSQSNKKAILNDPNNSCKRTTNLSLNTIAKRFPLNKSCKIQIVSFEHREVTVIDNPNDSNYIKNPELMAQDSLPRVGNKVDYKSLIECKTLTYNDTAKLSDILFNYHHNPASKVADRSASCYNPRNAVVFLDDKDEIVEFIEICFSCNQYYFFSKKDYDTGCVGKLELIKDFFIQKGMQYGTVEER